MEQVIVKNQSEEYMVNVIRSKRKTMALQVGLDGTVVARVPNRVAKKEVLRFLDSHAAWIAAAKKKMAADVLCTKDRSDVRTGCNPEPERTLGKLQQ